MRLLNKIFIDGDDKGRVVGQVHDLLGYAAHQEQVYTAATLGGTHDQIHAFALTHVAAGATPDKTLEATKL